MNGKTGKQQSIGVADCTDAEQEKHRERYNIQVLFNDGS